MRLAVKDWSWVTENTTFLLLLLLCFAEAEESNHLIAVQMKWKKEVGDKKIAGKSRSQSLIGSSIPAGSERRHQSLLSPSPRVHRASVTTRWRWQDLVLVGPTRVSNGVDPLEPSLAPHHAAPNPDLRGLSPSPGNSPRDQMDLCVPPCRLLVAHHDATATKLSYTVSFSIPPRTSTTLDVIH